MASVFTSAVRTWSYIIVQSVTDDYITSYLSLLLVTVLNNQKMNKVLQVND